MRVCAWRMRRVGTADVVDGAERELSAARRTRGLSIFAGEIVAIGIAPMGGRTSRYVIELQLEGCTAGEAAGQLCCICISPVLRTAVSVDTGVVYFELVAEGGCARMCKISPGDLN